MNYLQLYRGSARDLLLATGGGIAQSLVLIPIIWLVRHAFDEMIPGRDMVGLLATGLLMIGLYLASGALLLWSRSIALRSTRAAIERLRADLVRKIQRLPRERFVSDEAGHIHSLLVHDTERASLMSVAFIGQLLPAAVFSIALGLALLYMNWLLFLTVAAVVPVLTVAMRLIGRRWSQRVATFRAAFEQFSRSILFLVERMDLTRSHSAEEVELRRQTRDIGALGQSSANMALWSSAHTVAQETVTSVSWTLILVVGGVAVAQQAMTIGDVLAFSVAAMMLKRSVNTIVGAVPPVLEGRAALAALQALADEPDDTAYAGTRRLELARDVTLHDVRFSYGAQPLLDGVELRLERGRVTVISGPSGSGKTTLLFLIMGFYRPQQGTLRADGVAYDELDLRHLRRRLGFVPQDPVVFAGSVLENIAYGAAEVDMERVERAAATAGADEFIGRLAKGYETLVGEGGALLSGGQRQRIGLARALYHEPTLLLLDEPTNQLDERLAGRLLRNLRELPSRPGLLIVSHEIERVVGHADDFFELREGRLVAAPRADGQPAREREAVA
jgi:ABC-type bacteriocin/lantibiotic exporter with double-glycine peptidase domain